MNIDNLKEERIVDLTTKELIYVIIDELKKEEYINIIPEDTYMHKGLKGIMEIFQCAKSKAVAIRASGIIDDACIQCGNSFLIDRRTALELMKNNK